MATGKLFVDPRQALQADRARQDVCRNLADKGWALACKGRTEDAEVIYRQAAATHPGLWRRIVGAQHVEAGTYELGWKLVSQYSDTHWPEGPRRWDGGRIGGTLAVMPSGGLGDQILFARFIKHLKARVGRVVVAAPKPLLRLFRRIGADDVLPMERAPNDVIQFAFPPNQQPDTWIDMDALPCFLGARMDSIPTEPYLSAYPEDIERWRTQLPHDGLRVGLVWRACASARQAYRRSLPSLATLAPLWQVPGVSFVNLQRGDGEDEARASSLPLTLVDDRDLADTAAIIANLDLVIGTDVCVANLAGALGVPTWVLAEPYPNFRWRQGWYPSGRLFCQKVVGDWRDPVQEAAAALAELAATYRKNDR